MTDVGFDSGSVTSGSRGMRRGMVSQAICLVGGVRARRRSHGIIRLMIRIAALRARLAGSVAALRAVSTNAPLRRVELAFLGFSLAEWAIWIAILVYAYNRGGAVEAGVVALLQLAPAAVIAPLAASFGDRYPRDRVLLASYLLQAASTAAIALALLGQAPVAVVYGLAMVANAAITLTRPVQAAISPSLARTPAELTAANIAVGAIETVAIIIGPTAAGLILEAFGTAPVYLAASAVSIGSAVLVLGLPRVPVARVDGAPGAVGLGATLREAAGGFSMLARQQHPRSVMVLLGSAGVLWGSLDVLLVVLALDVLAIGQTGVGFLNAAVGAGGIAGAAIAVFLIGRPKLAGPFGVGVLVWGAGLAAVGLFVLPFAAAGFLAMAGLGRVVMDVAGRSLLQRVSPDALMSRVFGVLEGVQQGSYAVGSILAPALIAVAGPRGAFAVAGIALLLVVGLSWQRVLRVDAAGFVRPRELAALQSVPFFVPLNGPALERLAVALIPVGAKPGAVIIEQGDVGDQFCIITSGEVVVLVDGKPVRTLGPGQFFGEIALLRDVPRTASVLAASTVELLALDRHHFVEAVTGQPASALAADEVIHAHLHRPGGSEG